MNRLSSIFNNTHMVYIRKATRDDARAIWDLRIASILDQCVGYYSNDILEKWTSGEMSDIFLDNVERNYHVAIHFDLIVATGMINTQSGKIDAIFVHPDHMRKGLGKMMLHFLEEIARRQGVEKVILESSLNAVDFYRACGFEGIAASKYVSPRGITLDCVSMVKVIASNGRDGIRSGFATK